MSRGSTLGAVVYLGIGNSDDKLSQAEWSRFVSDTAKAIRAFTRNSRYRDGVEQGPDAAARIIGEWLSPSDAEWQNAAWCITWPEGLPERAVQLFETRLAHLAARFNQDSIAWAHAPQTRLIAPVSEPM